MPALAFSDFAALPDVLSLDRFELLLSPSGSTDLNAVLSVRCNQLSIPEEQIEPMLVSIQGLEFNYRGRHIFDRMIQATFVETIDAAVNTGIRTWIQQVAGSESGNGATKSQYATDGTINVFDQSGNAAIIFSLDNVWPSSLPQMQLDGSQAAPYYQQAGFTYDRFAISSVSPT